MGSIPVGDSDFSLSQYARVMLNISYFTYITIVGGIYESKSIFCGVYYLAVSVYTKTTIQLSVGG